MRRRPPAPPAATLRATIVAGLLFTGCRAAPPPPGDAVEHSLIDRLPAAVVEHERLRTVADEAEAGLERQPVLRQFAPGRLRFTGVETGRGAELVLALALDAALPRRSDGARAAASCTRDGRPVPLLAVDLAPVAGGPDAARWDERRLSLDRCDHPTDLVLEASCGAGRDCAGDGVLWGSPRVRLPRPFTTAVPRLVLLVSIDTLRADAVLDPRSRGAGRLGAPRLRRLAADGVAFETTVAPSSWTLPSHATLLGSIAPTVHRTTGVTPYPARLPLLAERFRGAGWRTAAFVDAAWLHERHGLARGFDDYDYGPVGEEARRGAARGLARIDAWLRAAPAAPAFLFWHLMDVHAPYGAPAPFGGGGGRTAPGRPVDPRLAALAELTIFEHLRASRFRAPSDLVAAYREGVAHADARVGELLDRLRAAGLYERATIAVVSDHGETLFEHGGWLTHGLLLAESEIRVPWILKLPDGSHAGRRVAEMVRLADVAPTLLEAVGLAPPEPFEGRSLLAALAGREPFPRVAEGWADNTGAHYVRTDGWKLVTAATRPAEAIAGELLGARGGVPDWLPGLLGEQLYELATDPGERRNRIADAPPGRLAELRRLAAAHRQASAERAARFADGAPPVEIPEEERARLRALGYLR